MKRLTGIIGCWPALFVLFTAELCRADPVFLASVGNNITMSDRGGQLPVPSLDDVWVADKLRDQNQSGTNNFSNRSGESDGISSVDNFDSRMGLADSAGNSPRERENSESPFQHYLLVALVIGAAGLAMIAAGVVQWWRRRSIRQNWLFSTVQEDRQPSSLPALSPAPLIAKKQQESLQESRQDKKSEKHSQRRAA